MAVDVLRAEVAVDDFKHEPHRRLLGICYRLSEEGEQPSYEKVMSAAEDPDLKRLVVTLEAAARAKAQKLRLDCAVEEDGDPRALLAKLIGLLKQAGRRAGSVAGTNGVVRQGPVLPERWTRRRGRRCAARRRFMASAGRGDDGTGAMRTRRENDELNLEDSHVHRLDDKLSELIAIGKGQGGWLTFSQVNDYLPDEAVNPEKLDMLLMTIEELGMEIVADKKLPYRPPEKKRGKNGKKGGAKGARRSPAASTIPCGCTSRRWERSPC